MKLECKHVWEHISGYLDKQLDAELLAAVETALGELRGVFGGTGFDAEYSGADRG